MTNPVRALMESLLPQSSMDEYRRQCHQQDERERQMIADIRRDCLFAMALLIDAAQSPRLSRQDIAEAIDKLRGALHWAEELER